MEEFIHIRSGAFAILPGEADEVVNEGMYGRALGEYLQQKLSSEGFDCPLVCHEDWGVWLEVRASFRLGVCIYAGPEQGGRISDWALTDGALGRKAWSWRTFKWVDRGQEIDALRSSLRKVLEADPEIEIVSVGAVMPDLGFG